MTEFLDLADSAELARSLSHADGVTLFVPNNGAIEKLPPELLDALAVDPDALRDVLYYHIVRGERRKNDLHNNELLASYNVSNAAVSNNALRVNVYPGTGAATANCVRITVSVRYCVFSYANILPMPR